MLEVSIRQHSVQQLCAPQLVQKVDHLVPHSLESTRGFGYLVLMNPDVFRQTLLERYARSKAKNSGYSIRAFARHLDVSHGALSEILHGKRNVSQKLAGKMCDRMLLSPRERRRIFGVHSASESEKNREYAQLTTDQFHAISEWQHFAILNLITLPKQKTDYRSLASRLGISSTEVLRSLNRLQRLGLVQEKNEKWTRTQARLQTSDEIKDVSIQQSHLNHLELASRKLREVQLDRRDFTTMTMGINSKSLPEAKKLIRDFLDRLSDLLEDESADEVFVFGTQLFPVTQENT